MKVVGFEPMRDEDEGERGRVDESGRRLLLNLQVEKT